VLACRAPSPGHDNLVVGRQAPYRAELIVLKTNAHDCDAPLQVEECPRVHCTPQAVRAVFALLVRPERTFHSRGRSSSFSRRRTASCAGRNGAPMSRSGLRYLLAKHVQLADISRTGIPSKVGPHTLRHSKAMHMLQAGVPLMIIRHILGHVDVKTTEVYAPRSRDEATRARDHRDVAGRACHADADLA
jgi:integrase